MMTAALRRILIVSALCLVMVGCASVRPEPPLPDMTLEEAKERTMQIEREIAALVPPENVAEITQNQTGYLFSCSMPERYSWMGFLRVTYSERADVAGVVARAEEIFSRREGFRFRDEPTLAGEPRLHMIGLTGESYFVHDNPRGTSLEISSYSPCVPLPEGAWPGSAF